MDSVEHIGLWWLPENPESKICGKLRYEWGIGSQLSINGIFDEKKKHHEIILGESRGEKFTLVNCLRRNFTKCQAGTGDYTFSTYGMSLFYKGQHFAKRDQIKFDRISIEYSFLQEWLATEIPFTERKEIEDKLCLEMAKPKMRQIGLKWGTLNIGGEWLSTFGTEGGSIGTKAVVIISSPYPKPMDELFSVAYHVKNFLRLAIGDKISILSIKAERDIELFSFQTVGDRCPKSSQTFCPMPIEYKDVSKSLELYLRNWFSFVQKMEPVYELFFANWDDKVHPIIEFLGLVQAVEAYHSRTHESKIISDDIFAEPQTSFLKIIDRFLSENKSEFRSKIEFMNRKSLRKRTKELFDENSDLFRIFVSNEEKFISAFVNARNYYTHYESETKNKVADALTEVPYLAEALRWMLMVLILKEIGLDENQIKRVINIYRINRIQKIYL